jgi:DNA ligase-1
VVLHDGRSLIEAPLVERLAVLDAVVPEPMRVQRLTTDDPETAAEFFRRALANGQEGVIVKRLDAPYDAGRRGSAWIKVKPRHTLDLVVLAVEWGSGRRSGWLSNIHLGARDPATDEFVMLGKTFKGMTDEMLAWQTERFLSLRADDPAMDASLSSTSDADLAASPSDSRAGDFGTGHIVRLRPEQVVEIAFDGVQRSSRYPGGVALRFARVLRYRDDKPVDEIDTIDTVRSLR